MRDSASPGQCATYWRPRTHDRCAAVSGRAVAADLGTIMSKVGSKQATDTGHPLDRRSRQPTTSLASIFSAPPCFLKVNVRTSDDVEPSACE